MSHQNRDVTRVPATALREALRRFPTPFYLYDEKRVRANCRRVARAFARRFPRFRPLYAVKANSNPRLVEIVFSEGWGSDASSEAEAWLTRRLGARGMYTGNYTTEAELRFVKRCGLLLNLDDVSMLAVLERIGVPRFLSFRVNPGITRGSMKSLLFAGDDAKYGIAVSDAVGAYRRAAELGVRRFGIHMMTGSNVLEEEYFETVTAKLLEVAGRVKKTLGIDFERVNIGGGFGVPYRPGERSLDVDRVAQGVRRAFDAQCERFGLREPTLMIEPGRYLLADAGWLVTTVHVIKRAKKTFVGVDAGMNDLPRPAIYDAYHHLSVLGATARRGPPEKVNVVGRLCENNDQFARGRLLPPVRTGDRIVIHTAGAHCYSMGHNYNNRPRSAEILFTARGRLRKIRRAETREDLFRTVLP